jgi:heme exporter protein CcmD
MSEIFSMGPHTQFVWSAYLLTFGVVFLNVYWARRAHRRAREEARRRLAMQEEPS